LNIRARLVIGFVEQHIVELPLIDHFPASASLEVAFFGFAQLVKVSRIHNGTLRTSCSRCKGAPADVAVLQRKVIAAMMRIVARVISFFVSAMAFGLKLLVHV
jgi:hypothetical protein